MKNIVNKFFLFYQLLHLHLMINFDKHLELSYAKTSGNSNTNTFSTKLEATTKLSEKSDFRAKGSALYSENEDKTSANKYDVELDYNRMLDEKIYYYYRD